MTGQGGFMQGVGVLFPNEEGTRGTMKTTVVTGQVKGQTIVRGQTLVLKGITMSLVPLP